MKAKIRNREGAVLFTVDGANGVGDLEGADLTGANLIGAVLTDANLTNASLVGADLTGAKLRDVTLAGANLTDANLTKANLTKANLTKANLTKANLTNAILTNAILRDAVLCNAILAGCFLVPIQLEQLASGIPHVKELDQKVLAAITLEGGTLDMMFWHLSARTSPVCESTHCRAGWAIHLAGIEGYALEDLLGASTAGALIYLKSTGRPVPDFQTSTAKARADILRRAALYSIQEQEGT